ncbi:transglycosylase SLT domain-containing protein [bacterium]|nr:transglycosylase SLT domain-containing protein [bacterium]
MRRTRTGMPNPLDAGTPSAIHIHRRRAKPFWLLLVAVFVTVGLFLVALTMVGLAGMVRLISSPAQSTATISAPVLIVAPDLSALSAAPAEATPASAALQEMVASPLPTPAATPTPSIAPTDMAPPAAVVTTEEEAVATSVIVPLPTAPSLTYRALFEDVGNAYGIDWRLLAALAFRESRLDPNAVGRDGDMGLMQIIPTTWDEFAPHSNAEQPFDARHNVEVAATYLLYLQEKLNEVGHGEIYWVLVAYNWGPNNVRRLLNEGGNWDDVPARQRQYVADILEAAFGIRFGD